MPADVQFAKAAGIPLSAVPPPSRAKAMIDAFLSEHRFQTILSQDQVTDLLLDLRAEV